MKYSELFMLSFVSKKMKKLIKLSQEKRFKSISSVRYDYDGADELMVHVYYGDIKEMITKTQKHNEAKSVRKSFQLNLSGKMINFRFLRPRSRYVHPIASYLQPSEKETVIQSIHNYLFDLFGNSVEYNWLTTASEWLGRSSIPTLPQIQNLSFCVDINLFPETNNAEMERLEKFFSSSPVLKSVRMVAVTNQSFPSKSKLYQAESVEIRQEEIIDTGILRNFQGRQAFLRCGEVSTSVLVEFLNKWKSGEVFKKLEYLKVIMDPVSPGDRGFNGIVLNYIDATKQPPTHAVFNWQYYTKSNTDPITSHTYVVREADNFVASILVEEEAFSFGVWNKTEEEFLKMVE
ncbi:unnamed protein product [Caenorhabditis nigoni]